MHPDGPLAGVPELQDDRGAADDGKARFDTVRVGRPVEAPVAGGPQLVPVEVTPYDGDEPVDAYVVMVEGGDGWKVTDLVRPGDVVSAGVPVCTDDGCPGFPIERPERAPIGFWFGALALGVLIAVGCSAAVRAATPGGRGGREAVSAAAS